MFYTQGYTGGNIMNDDEFYKVTLFAKHKIKHFESKIARNLIYRKMKSRSANRIKHIVLIHCNLLRIMNYFQTSLTKFLSANSIQPNKI